MESDAATLVQGSCFGDRYEILETLGSGSFGRVYRARQLSTGQSVAIKLLAPREGAEESTAREVERFRRETQIGATLSHPNIVALIDSGETRDGQLYAVFAHVPGATLEQVLAREGALDARESVRLMTQVLEALEVAHAKGVVHRDLKPSNLMLSGTAPRRHAVVLDFGLGGLAEGRRRKEWQTLTQTREFLGTPLYASPEQLAGEPATQCSDLYAWGLVFLECLTGRSPFAEAGAAERLLTGGGAVEIPEWLRGHRLGELLQRVTAREAAQRDVTSEALLEALEEIARGELPEAPEATPTPAPLSEPGERRHLTVLFCDLVGSSALGQRLETEAYRRVVQAYHARAAEAIERYEGHVAQYLGDGLLVYFGYPQAHEDDAERAVRAGREILRALRTLNVRLETEQGLRLQARVGIHSGPVVVADVGSGAKKETLALGDTVNVAARLEGFAEPDTVVISDATLRLVAGLFATEDRGVPALKGIAEPIRAHRVIEPSGVTSRLDRAPKLTPFVGREQELGLLLDRFAQAREGRGQAVLVGGEAGIGKSRLVYELHERLREAQMPHSWLEGRTTPYAQHSPFRTVIELVEQALGFDDALTADEKVARLERGLAHAGLEPAETVPLFASLLSLRLPERYAALEISPQLQRQRTLEALLAWVLALGERQPLVLVVEDLHWADPSTLEWLGLVVEQCATAGLLLVLTHRPAFEPPWPSRAHRLAITLGRLEREAARMLAVAASSGSALPEALVDRIATRSDGVPLFVEELTKGMAETGRDLAGSLSGLQIPETLQDSLMARLDRLGEAKPVAQLGAAIGREFSYPLIEAVAPLKQPELREALGQLVEAELVYQRGLPPKAVYTFKHALVQDAAYQSLLDSQRKELHGRIAVALIERMPESAEQQPERVAHHLSEGADPSRAIEYWQRAGDRALARAASQEARSHFARGLELLAFLPDGASRQRRELPLRIGVGAAGSAGLEHGTDAFERTWRRALELADRLDDRKARARALWGLSALHHARSEFRTSLRLALELRDTGRALGDIWMELAGWNLIGHAHFLLGEPEAALEQLDQLLARDPVSESDPSWYVYGVCQRTMARAWGGWASLACGYPERAVTLGSEAISMAKELPSFLDRTIAIVFGNNTLMAMRQTGAVRANAEALRALAEEHRLGPSMGLAKMQLAWADAVEDIGGEDPAAAFLEGFNQARAGARGRDISTATHTLWMHADVLRCVGRLDEAEEWAKNALALADAKEQHFWAAEVHRTLGEISLAREEPDDAEAARRFERALEVARSQHARFYELRAAMSLARLLRDQGRCDEARVLLRPVYDWFTEGFDTVDLRDAKALLEELA